MELTMKKMIELQEIKTFPDKVGNITHFYEYIGKRRLQVTTTVVKYVPGKDDPMENG